MEKIDPELFEELGSKMRWSYVSKDPSKVGKDPKHSYWAAINHLSKDRVSKIVTDTALRMDQRSVKQIL